MNSKTKIELKRKISPSNPLENSSRSKRPSTQKATNKSEREAKIDLTKKIQKLMGIIKVNQLANHLAVMTLKNQQKPQKSQNTQNAKNLEGLKENLTKALKTIPVSYTHLRAHET